MYGILNISTSGLIAQRTRLEVSAANLANAASLVNDAGEYEPFRRRFAVLAAGDASSGRPDGVRVASIEIDDGPLNLRHEPGSPFADENGYVGYPNVNVVVEQMNMMVAARAYEANIAAIEATKSMMSAALQIVA